MRSPSYLRFAYVPAPHSIYRGIGKLAPGTGVTIDDRREDATSGPIWSLMDVGEARQAAPLVSNDRRGDRRARDAAWRCGAAAAGRRRAARRLSVRRHRFLDGRGVDAGAQQRARCRTFSIGFKEKATTRRRTPGGRGPSRHRPHRALRQRRRGARTSSPTCRRSTTSPSPTPRRSRLISCRS